MQPKIKLELKITIQNGDKTETITMYEYGQLIMASEPIAELAQRAEETAYRKWREIMDSKK